MPKMSLGLHSQSSQFIKEPMFTKRRNYMDKEGRKGRLTNIPMGQTGHESSGKLTKKGQVYRNNLMDMDLTSQIPTKRKLKGA